MTLVAAHAALHTLLAGTAIEDVDGVYAYEDPSLYGQGRTVVTVSFGSPAMTGESWGLAIRIYASWANSFPKAHAALLAAIQNVDDALGDTYPRGVWETGANVQVDCFVATTNILVGRDDF